MNFPSRETVERLRREYPVGCRIVLDEMDDPYTKIPVGAQATCQGVDVREAPAQGERQMPQVWMPDGRSLFPSCAEP